MHTTPASGGDIRQTPLAIVFALLWEFLIYEALALRGYKDIRRAVIKTPAAVRRPDAEVDIPTVESALHRACAWYFKRVLCLQRSVAITRFLRRRGIPASLVIGCQMMPVRAHAWVEVDGVVVSDDLRDRLAFYQVLERW